MCDLLNGSACVCTGACGGEKIQTQSKWDKIVIMVESKYKVWEYFAPSLYSFIAMMLKSEFLTLNIITKTQTSRSNCFLDMFIRIHQRYSNINFSKVGFVSFLL